MSLILDALRRRSPSRQPDGAPHTARADTVLKTLGYSRRRGRSGLSIKTIILYGAAAVLVGFIGLSLIITLLVPSEPTAPVQRSAAATPAPARPPAAPPRAIEYPRLPPEEPASESTKPSPSPAPADNPSAPSAARTESS
ncbi:MAG: hypothetical protein Q7J25_11805, partial [Vicinamibacterales bacterium]|nr:hypothetical protein [Vicinamibacterales bacterium]